MTLLETQQWFAATLPRLLDQAIALGFAVTMGECYRTPEQAALDAQHGTGIAHSLHTLRLAVDLQLFKDGVYLTDTNAYEPLGAWWEAQSTAAVTCCWGGRFTRADGNHFSVEHEGIR